MNLPTQQELMKAIDYDPINGTFRWTHHESVYLNVRGKVTAKSGNKGHRKLRYNNVEYRAHHVAWLIVYGYWPDRLDHKNNIRHDNRISNLREASHQQNQMNRVISKNNTSGYKGVATRKNGFEAKLIVNKRYIHLGKFTCAREAALVYDAAALKYHGKFRQNQQTNGSPIDRN